MACAPVWRFAQAYYGGFFSRRQRRLAGHGGSARLPSIDSVLIFSMVNHAFFCLAAASRFPQSLSPHPNPYPSSATPYFCWRKAHRNGQIWAYPHTLNQHPHPTHGVRDHSLRISGSQRRQGSSETHILDIPHARGDVHVLAQDLLDLLAAGGLHDDGAAGEGEGRGVV